MNVKSAVVSTFALAAMSMLAGCAQAASSWSCPLLSSESVVVPSDQQDGCVDFERGRARALKDPAWLATGCTVTITADVHSYDACLPPDGTDKEFLKVSDRMRVDQFGKDDFRLTIWRPNTASTANPDMGKTIVSNVQLHAPTLKDNKHYGWLQGDDASGRTYFVYLTQTYASAQAGDVHPIGDKFYAIEVYTQSMCLQDHSPPHTQSSVKSCDSPMPGAGTSGQGNTGGGGEPPPR